MVPEGCFLFKLVAQDVTLVKRILVISFWCWKESRQLDVRLSLHFWLVRKSEIGSVFIYWHLWMWFSETFRNLQPYLNFYQLAFRTRESIICWPSHGTSLGKYRKFACTPLGLPPGQFTAIVQTNGRCIFGNLLQCFKVASFFKRALRFSAYLATPIFTFLPTAFIDSLPSLVLFKR